MTQPTTRTILMTLAAIAFAATAGADLKRTATDAEGRRKAAENGVQQIKARGNADRTEIQAAYRAAATAHNAWLDATLNTVVVATPDAPDVSALADAAARSLVPWVNQRNTALGLPTLGDSIAPGVVRATRDNLVGITAEAWRDSRRARQEKRDEISKLLGERLRWKAWDAIR